MAGASGALMAANFVRAANIVVASRKPTDIRVEHVGISFEDYLYRSPVKFAGALMDRATILNVECMVKTRGGKVAKGIRAAAPMRPPW